jgi:hypothetical protein
MVPKPVAEILQLLDRRHGIASPGITGNGSSFDAPVNCKIIVHAGGIFSRLRDTDAIVVLIDLVQGD